MVFLKINNKGFLKGFLNEVQLFSCNLSLKNKQELWMTIPW